MGDSDFRPPGALKPGTDRVKIWHDWLRPTHDRTYQNWDTPLKGIGWG